MEEILASIRKIISEDDPEGQGAEGGAASEEDVLELTDRVAGPADPESTEEQEIDAILASVTEADETGSGGTAASGGAGGLVSPRTDSAVTTTLAGFADELLKEKAASAGSGAGGPTLDHLVLAAIEPHLKTWLDQNLEPLVERVVREELKRMARRAEDL